MKYTKGQCIQCPKGEERYIVNRSRMLCQYHNQARLNEKSSERRKQKAEKRREEGRESELDFFYRIWRERPHVCFVTGKTINDSPDKDFSRWLMCFSHIIPKGHYPDALLDEENMILKLPEMHKNWHSLGKSELVGDPTYGDKWRELFALKARLTLKYSTKKG